MENQIGQPVMFNHFHKQFLRDIPRIKAEQARNRISEGNGEPEDLFEFVYMERLSQKEEIAIYNQSLWNICSDYIVLANAKIDVIPKDLFDFINLILDTMEENPYSDSFLQSLTFIYQEYLGCLGVGFPACWQNDKEKEEPHLEVTIGFNHQMTDFRAVNISSIEQDRIMTKMVSMAIKEQKELITDPEQYKPSKVIIKEYRET